MRLLGGAVRLVSIVSWVIGVGCSGSGGAPSPDEPPDAAGRADASADARATEPAVGQVQVIALADQGGVDYEAWFVVSDRDGAPWAWQPATAVPGATWTSLDVPAGAMVTMLRRDLLGYPQRTTFVGVEPGDQLISPMPSTVSGFDLVRAVTVRLPRFSADVRRYEIDLVGGCHGERSIPADQQPPELIEVSFLYEEARCRDPQGETSGAMVASAFDASGARVGTIARDGGIPNVIDWSALPWSAPQPHTLSASSIPPGPVGLPRFLCARPWSADRSLITTGTELVRPLPEQCAPIPSAQVDFTAAPLVPDIPSVVWERSARVQTGALGNFVDRSIGPDPTASFDLSWMSSTPQVAIDQYGVRPEVRFTGDDAYQGGVTFIPYGPGGWRVVHPRGAFRLPALPDQLAGVYAIPDSRRLAVSQLFLPGRFASYDELRTGVLLPTTAAPMEERTVTVESPLQ